MHHVAAVPATVACDQGRERRRPANASKRLPRGRPARELEHDRRKHEDRKRVGDHADARKALADPGVKSRLETLGNATMDMSPQEFTRLVRTDMDDYAKVLKAAGVKPQ